MWSETLPGDGLRGGWADIKSKLPDWFQKNESISYPGNLDISRAEPHMLAFECLLSRTACCEMQSALEVNEISVCAS